MNDHPHSDVAVAIFCVLVALVFGLMGSACGRPRRAGFWLGFLFGPLGLLIAFVSLSSPRRRRARRFVRWQ